MNYLIKNAHKYLPKVLSNKIIREVAAIVIQKVWYEHKLRKPLYYWEYQAENHKYNIHYLPKHYSYHTLALNNYIIAPPQSGRTEIMKDILREAIDKEPYLNFVVYGRKDRKHEYEELLTDMDCPCPNKNYIRIYESIDEVQNSDGDRDGDGEELETNDTSNKFHATSLEQYFQYQINQEKLSVYNRKIYPMYIILDEVIQNENELIRVQGYYKYTKRLNISFYIISNRIFNFPFGYKPDCVYFHHRFLRSTYLNRHLFNFVIFTLQYIRLQSMINNYNISIKPNTFMVVNNEIETQLAWIMPQRNLR